jgi:hypothetical protein
MLKIFASKVNLFGNKYMLYVDDGKFFVRIYDMGGLTRNHEEFPDYESANTRYKQLIKEGFYYGSQEKRK